MGRKRRRGGREKAAVSWDAEEKAAENQLMVPAVEGTRNVVRAAKGADGVRQVVVTSSISALVPSPGWPSGEVLDERCWTDIDYCEKNGVESCCRKEDVEQTFCEMRRDGLTWLGLMGHVSAEQVYKPGQHHDSTMDGKCDSTRVQKKGRAKQKDFQDAMQCNPQRPEPSVESGAEVHVRLRCVFVCLCLLFLIEQRDKHKAADPTLRSGDKYSDTYKTRYIAGTSYKFRYI